jgi:hypothetical protein
MAKNSIGESISREARMTVLQAQSNSNSPSRPQFVEPPPGDSAIDNADESDYLVMHCIATGNPQPTISWSFNDQPLLESDHVYIYDNGTLVLHLPEEEHEGNYKCESTNNLGVKSTVAIYRISGELSCFFCF